MPRKETRNAHGFGTIRKRKDGLWEGFGRGSEIIRKNIFAYDAFAAKMAFCTMHDTLIDRVCSDAERKENYHGRA